MHKPNEKQLGVPDFTLVRLSEDGMESLKNYLAVHDFYVNIKDDKGAKEWLEEMRSYAAEIAHDLMWSNPELTHKVRKGATKL